MVTTQMGHVESVIQTLLQLAQLVEHTGVTPAEVGARLENLLLASGGTGEAEARNLLKLCKSDASSAEFASGLRRQAEQLRTLAIA